MVNIIEYDNSYLKTADLNIFIDIIYDHFIHLTTEPKLSHNKQSIKETFLKPTTSLFIMTEYINNKERIIAYLLGYKIILNDDRRVFFISYIFVAESYRRKGIGKTMMKFLEDINMDIDGILLICDTEHEKVLNFYLEQGYMYDTILRRYERYDVLYKTL